MLGLMIPVKRQKYIVFTGNIYKDKKINKNWKKNFKVSCHAKSLGKKVGVLPLSYIIVELIITRVKKGHCIQIKDLIHQKDVLEILCTQWYKFKIKIQNLTKQQ